MDKPSHFKIFKYQDTYVVYNKNGGKDNHTHIGNKGTCNFLIKMVCKKIIPKSPYLKESAIRISLDKNYISEIERVL